MRLNEINETFFEGVVNSTVEYYRSKVLAGNKRAEQQFNSSTDDGCCSLTCYNDTYKIGLYDSGFWLEIVPDKSPSVRQRKEIIERASSLEILHLKGSSKNLDEMKIYFELNGVEREISTEDMRKELTDIVKFVTILLE